MPTITTRSTARAEFIDVTEEVASLTPADLEQGLCQVFCAHTTAGVTINENADPDVVRDMLAVLEKLVPWKSPEYRHGEGNSAAHVKASLMGPSVTVPVDNGRLRLGTWQGIYLCEFDGPRERRLDVRFVETRQAAAPGKR